jgi:hypothetical protein
VEGIGLRWHPVAGFGLKHVDIFGSTCKQFVGVMFSFA